MSLLASLRAALVTGLILSVIGCASAPPTVESINAAQAAREGKCEQQGYKRGSRDFNTCLQLAANQEATASTQGMLGTVAGIGGASLALSVLSAFSDERLKRDIVPLGVENGYRVYRFKYLWSDVEYVGVMAQEVRATTPEAVSTGADGYLRVNYAMLGLHMTTFQEWQNRRRSNVQAFRSAHPAQR